MPSDSSAEANFSRERDQWRQIYFRVHGREPDEAELSALLASEAASRARPLRRNSAAKPGPPPPSLPLTAVTPDDIDRSVLLSQQNHLSLFEAVQGFVHLRPAVTMSAAVSEYLIAKRCQGLREDSLRGYRDQLTVFNEQFPDLTVAQVTPRHVIDYIFRWANVCTRRHRWQTLATFFAWAQRRGYCPGNPVFLAMNRPARPRPERCIYTPDEAAAILRRTRETDQFGYWAVALFAGLRTSEIRWLEEHPDPWSLVRCGVIDLRDQPPKSYPRVVPIPPVLVPWLERMLRRSVSFMPANHWVVRERVKRSALEARYTNSTASPEQSRFHNMPRRSCICYRLALPGASYAEVCHDMGNSEQVLRSHYARRVSRDEAERYFSLTPDKL